MRSRTGCSRAVARAEQPAVAAIPEDRLRRLIEAGSTLVSELEVEAVLANLLEAACDITGARYAALGVLNEAGDALDRFLTVGIDEPTRAAIGDLPRGHGVLGVLITDPQPLRLSDVSEHPRSYGFPAGHPPMQTFLGVPVRLRGAVYGNLYMTEKTSGEFDEGDEAAAVLLAEWAGIAIENARLYEQATRRADELARSAASIEASLAVARAVGGETELSRILELIVKRGRDLVDADAMVIALYEGGRLTVSAVAGELDRALEGTAVQLPGSAVADVINRQRTLHVHDDGAPVHIMAGITARAGLIVPLVFRTTCVGVLCALDPLDGNAQFDMDHQRLLEAFASSGATAVATGKNVAQERMRRTIEASEVERRRWARELHDETLQDLASLKLKLAAARRSEDLAAVRAVLDDVSEQLTIGIRSLRQLIGELRPAVLDDAGLRPALESLISRSARPDLTLTAEIELDGVTERLPREIEETVYRVVQEALTNIAKHAEATAASVTVRRRDGIIELIVADDGVGIDLGETTSGYGLLGINERIDLVGGTLEIRPTAGGGTTVTATIPI
jgi:signal transduction histidine kinase